MDRMPRLPKPSLPPAAVVGHLRDLIGDPRQVVNRFGSKAAEASDCPPLSCEQTCAVSMRRHIVGETEHGRARSRFHHVE